MTKLVDVIDRKFIIEAVNPCNGKRYTEKNAILFVAKDAALVPTLRAYLAECKKLDCNVAHLDSIALLIERVIEYQDKVEKRVPDTKGECEIARCIDGEF